MKRMTTDNPQTCTEAMLNMARAENGQVMLGFGDEVVTLTEYVSKYAKETGCDVTPESVMDGDNCCECDCPVAILNILGIQAAENNARLKTIEKILGDDYDLNRLEQLLEACKGLESNEIEESKFLVATQKDPEKMVRLRELIEADRRGHCVVLPVKLGDTIYSIREDFYNYRKHSGVQRGEVVGFEYDKTWMIWVRLDDAIPRTRHAFKVKDFGKVIFNNREEAELSLKAVEGVKQDGN